MQKIRVVLGLALLFCFSLSLNGNCQMVDVDTSKAANFNGRYRLSASDGRLYIRAKTGVKVGVANLTDISTVQVDNLSDDYIPYWDGLVWRNSSIVDSSGKIGINKTNPSVELDIVGAGKISGELTVGGHINGLKVGLGGGDFDTNVALGYASLNANTTGSDNIAIGKNALFYNETSPSNIAIGSYALYLVEGTSAHQNIAIGKEAMSTAGMAVNNIVLGYKGLNALDDKLQSNSNIAIGSRTGSSATQSNNSIFIGHNSEPAGSSETNQIVIGTFLTGNGSNTTTIGGSSMTDTYLYGEAHIEDLDVSGGVSISGNLELGAIADVEAEIDAKQATLVSATNIKTIEGNTLLGSGNIDLGKADVGLGSADNTSDTDKPVSTAGQAALDLKANLASPTFTGTVAATGFDIAQFKTYSNILESNVATSRGGRIRAAVSSAANPTFSFQDDTNTGLFSTTADILGLATAGSVAVTIDASQNVGIGTASPAAKMEIAGSSGNYQFSGVGNQFSFTGATVNYIRASNSVGSLRFRTGGDNDRLTIDYTGKVGIGTPSPSDELHVNGTARATKILVNTGTDSGEELIVNGTAKISGDVEFGAKVGIGTPSPSTKLDIQGAGGSTLLNMSASSSGTGYILGQIANEGGTTYIGADNSTGSAFGGGNYASVFGAGAANPTTLITNGVPRLTILPTSGNVGIGTTAPTEKLDINSDAIRIRTASTPASASATGAVGEIRWDSSYMYVCTATNTWKRSAIATW